MAIYKNSLKVHLVYKWKFVFSYSLDLVMLVESSSVEQRRSCEPQRYSHGGNPWLSFIELTVCSGEKKLA